MCERERENMERNGRNFLHIESLLPVDIHTFLSDCIPICVQFTSFLLFYLDFVVDKRTMN